MTTMYPLMFTVHIIALVLGANELSGETLLTATHLRKNQGVKRQRQVTEKPRIVGGTPVSAGSYQFFVQWDGCAATLIHADIVLSAAHCNIIKSNAVLVGPYLSQSTKGGAVFRTIVARSVHPSYSASSLKYDYLVMKLNKNVTQTPIAMNSKSNHPVVGQNLTVIGFGVTSQGSSSLSSTLQQVTVDAISQQTCNSDYSGGIDANTMLCAGTSQGGKDSCQGDSGGPIFDSNEVLVGSVSFGHGCGQIAYPGIYARVSTAYNWITQQICALSSHPPSSCPPQHPTATVAPTPNGCSDSNNNFALKSVTRSCKWLKRNIDQYRYLCTQSGSQAASTCPSTCGVC